jgi:hypothetical protein
MPRWTAVVPSRRLGVGVGEENDLVGCQPKALREATPATHDPDPQSTVVRLVRQVREVSVAAGNRDPIESSGCEQEVESVDDRSLRPVRTPPGAQPCSRELPADLEDSDGISADHEEVVVAGSDDPPIELPGTGEDRASWVLDSEVLEVDEVVMTSRRLFSDGGGNGSPGYRGPRSGSCRWGGWVMVMTGHDVALSSDGSLIQSRWARALLKASDSPQAVVVLLTSCRPVGLSDSARVRQFVITASQDPRIRGPNGITTTAMVARARPMNARRTSATAVPPPTTGRARDSVGQHEESRLRHASWGRFALSKPATRDRRPGASGRALRAQVAAMFATARPMVERRLRRRGANPIQARCLGWHTRL